MHAHQIRKSKNYKFQKQIKYKNVFLSYNIQWPMFVTVELYCVKCKNKTPCSRLSFKIKLNLIFVAVAQFNNAKFMSIMKHLQKNKINI